MARILIGSQPIIVADNAIAGGTRFVLQAARVVDVRDDLATAWIARGLASSSAAALTLPDAATLHADPVQQQAYVAERTCAYPFSQHAGHDALATKIANAWGYAGSGAGGWVP